MIQDNSPVIVYTADGTQTEWNITFQLQNAGEITLYTYHDGEMTPVLATDFLVDVDNQKVTYPVQAEGVEEQVAPLPQGDRLVILRANAITQEEDSSLNAFKSADVEDIADKLTKICQELDERISRCIAYNPVDAENGETDAQEYINDFQDLVTEATAQAGIATNKAGEAATSATAADTAKTAAQKWAEGTDAQVEELGGEHSAKEWSNVAKYYAETIGAALKYKGSVGTYSNLPSSGQQIGDFWNVLDTGKNYAWTGTEWDDISGIMDLSAYRTAAAQDVIDSGKQDTLVSGTNIKTINSNSLLGNGNIDIDSLPSQTGQSGKFLTTDGTDASWAAVDALPSQTGQSGKFLTTNGSAASWATVDALPSQTGNQGKYLTTNGSTASWEAIACDMPLFYHTFADHLFSDTSWLRADTFSWQDGSVYTSAYQHLVNDIADKTAETETVGSITITFYRADDGHKICLRNQELNVLGIYNETGVAWYYVLDTADTRFKLPRTKYNVVGLRDTVGNYVSESLPNIAGDTGYRVATGNASTDPTGQSTGCIITSSSLKNGAQSSTTYLAEIRIDASHSSSTYQDNAPVQQRATQMYLYFYVGNTVQGQTTIDVGQITEDLNGKADIDLGNVSATGKSTSAGWAMPSTVSTSLTLGASGTEYTAPANGYVVLAVTSGLSYFYLVNKTTGLASGVTQGGTGFTCRLFIPVQKDDKFEVDYQLTPDAYSFTFIYAEGSKTEANNNQQQSSPDPTAPDVDTDK